MTGTWGVDVTETWAETVVGTLGVMVLAGFSLFSGDVILGGCKALVFLTLSDACA
jgi:hypothetical protein